MFEATTMLYVYVETPLHAGSGRALGNVDLPIQRERVTGYPIVQASSLKGRLRAESQAKEMLHFEAVFGPETDNADKHAGALSPGDAKILLFPVRSLAGVFAWTTSAEVLHRFLRDAKMVGIEPEWTVPEAADNEVLVSSNALKAGDKVVLEEFTFTPKVEQTVRGIGQWLAKNALPQADEYNYWRRELPKRLVILPNDDFRDFVTFSTEVATRIKLDLETKTVQERALWTEEYLPTDTLLYAPLMATPTRKPNDEEKMTGQQILDEFEALDLTRTQLGGNETVGRGSVYLRFA
jgi:CRISPR-associated protein Cmr4